MTPIPLLASDDAPPVGPLLLVGAISVLFLVYGVAHYRGWQKGGLLRLPFDSMHFAPAWLGGGGLIMVVGSLLSRVSVAFVVVTAVGIIPVAVALVGLFWLPRRLLPSWYLTWHDQGRPATGRGRWQSRNVIR